MRNPYFSVSRSLASHSTINSGTYFYPVFSLGCKPVTQTLTLTLTEAPVVEPVEDSRSNQVRTKMLQREVEDLEEQLREARVEVQRA